MTKVTEVRTGLEVAPHVLATAIHSCTEGHTGLVGMCLMRIEDAVRNGGKPVTEGFWRWLETGLPFQMVSRPYDKYTLLVHALLDIMHHTGVRYLMEQMLNNAGVCPLGDPLCYQKLDGGEAAWERLVWLGIAIGPDDNGDLRLSSTLLLRILTMAAVRPTNIPRLPEPPPSLTSRVVVEWMLINGIRYMPLACALAPKPQSTLGPSAEYGVRLDLAATIATALELNPSLFKYSALTDVRIPKHIPSRRTVPPLDYVYCDEDLPKVLVAYCMLPGLQDPEDVRSVIQDNLESSNAYAKKLHDTCFMVSISVRHNDNTFSLWGRDPTLLTAAGLHAPRDARTFAGADGSNSFTEEQLSDLQLMLDAFPPIKDKDVPASVVLVDVALLVDEGIGLVRFQDTALVHHVKLEGSREKTPLTFDLNRLS